MQLCDLFIDGLLKGVQSIQSVVEGCGLCGRCGDGDYDEVIEVRQAAKQKQIGG